MSTPGNVNERADQGDAPGDHERGGDNNRELSLFQRGTRHPQLLLRTLNSNRRRMEGNMAPPPQPNNNNNGIASSSRIPFQLMPHGYPPLHMTNEGGGAHWPNFHSHERRNQEIHFGGLVGPSNNNNGAGTSNFHPSAAAGPSYQPHMRMAFPGNRLPYHHLQPGSSGTWHTRNSVYDPMYEQVGLPVDPYLRMFLFKRNQGNDFF